MQEPFNYFKGQHCETTATGTLLLQLGIDLSEPILFGLGQGLSFIFWKMKTMDFPFIGGRIKPDLLTQNIAHNLNLHLTVKETSSPQKAWEAVQQLIDKGKVAGLKLDCFHLEYFSDPFHFAGHYAALYNYNATDAFLVDTQQQGGKVKTSLKNLALARAEKGPMSSKNLFYTIEGNSDSFDLQKAIRTAIKKNANAYLNPPITNIAWKGILKTSGAIKKWFHSSKNIASEFKTAAVLMEDAGTGGALFRNLYRDFLKESYSITNLEQIKSGHAAFAGAASLWTTVANLFLKISETEEFSYIEEASGILKIISEKEKHAMEVLATI